MIYVNGDSWSWHKDLYSADIWPNLLAQQLKTNCVNESIGCGSNSRILDNVTNLYISGLRPALIVLALTVHHRYHLPSADMGSWSISPQTVRNDRLDVTDDYVKNWYYIHGHNEVDSIYRYYRDVWLLHEICKKFECPFFIFQIWDKSIQQLGLLESTKNIKNFLNNNQIDLSKQQGQAYLKSFLFFSKQQHNWNYSEETVLTFLNNDDLAIDGHPNKKGHKKIGDFVINELIARDLISGGDDEQGWT